MERIGYVNVCVLLVLYQASLITAFTLTGSSTNATAGFQFNLTCETSSIYLIFQKDSSILCVIIGVYPNATCQLTGSSNTNYTYSCTPASNTYKVIIPGGLVTESLHKSQWSCGDPFGAGLAQYILHVNVPVSSITISSKPTDTNPVNVIQGRGQTFSCTTNAGRPPARIQWYLSMNNLTTSATPKPDVCNTDCKDDKVISSSELTYVGSLNDDGQTIYCTAVNTIAGGVRSTDKTVVIFYGPSQIKITPSNASYIVKEKGNIGPILCTADCKPNCTLKWTGPNLPPDITSMLNLQNIDRNQSGNYQCTARNEVSSMPSNYVIIIVIYGPTFVNIYPSTESYTVVERSSIGPITCTAECNPNCTTTWTGPNLSTGTTFILNLQNIDRNQSGNYQCIARNYISSMPSAYVYISVNYGPRVIKIEPSYSSYIKNESLESLGPITCKAECKPACRITWYGPDLFYGVADVLIFLQINRHQAGNYSCKAENYVSILTSVVLSLIVNYNPTITEIDNNKTVSENTTLMVTCKVESNPLSNVMWMFANTLVDTDETYILSNKQEEKYVISTLTIRRIKCLSMGIYRCEAHNILGETDRSMYVTVECSPRIVCVDCLRTVIPIKEEGLNITVPLIGFPTPTMFWRFLENGLWTNASGETFNYAIINRHWTTFLKRNLKSTEFGFYRLYAYNGVGNITDVLYSFEVIPVREPTRPNYVHVVCKSTTALLFWQSSYNGGIDQYFKIQFWTFAESTRTTLLQNISDPGVNFDLEFTVNDLSFQTSYWFIITAINSKGNSSSKIVNCTTDNRQENANSQVWIGLFAASISALILTLMIVAVVIRCRLQKTRNKSKRRSKTYIDLKTIAAGSTDSYTTLKDVGFRDNKESEAHFENIVQTYEEVK